MAELAAPLLLALYEPDIAQNAGAMMRTCACLGVEPAIIEPAGFRTVDSRFRRAAMDYLGAVSIASHASWDEFEAWRAAARRRLVLLTTQGETNLWDFSFAEGDVILVGREFGGRASTRQKCGRCPALDSDSRPAPIAQRRRRGDNRDDRSAPPAGAAAARQAAGLKALALPIAGA